MGIRSIKKKIYISLATICVGLGFAGTCLPVLPTTPFLLLAIFLYMRSSKERIKRILRNPYLAPYIKSYFSRRGIPTPLLIRTLILLWLTIGVCIVFFINALHIRILLGFVAVGVTVHLYLRSSIYANRRAS